MSRSDPPAAPDFLRLAQPPLVLSAAAECLAGAFISSGVIADATGYLLALASALLFGAGALFGYHFDQVTRQRERAAPFAQPEDAGARRAWLAGWALLVAGCGLAGVGGRDSVLAAIGVALAVVVYASTTKGVWGAGFLTL
ncbi:MAG TPA: hypothetical protein VFU47_01910, partial [Armatimonadota bacterium]|nr:hypothetical protein [Armatimonadota bacterium]